jgi:hypothetical protein
METFDLTGPIAGLIYTDAQYNTRVMSPEIISGKWELRVVKGKVSYFIADFEQIAISGNMNHRIQITNFTEDENNRDIQLTSNETVNIAIRGTGEVIVDQKPMKNIAIEIFIKKLKVIEMRLYVDSLDPFRGKPITGVIDLLINKSGFT